MHLSKEQLRRIWLEDRRKERRRLGIALAATAAVFAFCLCFRYNAYYYEDKFVPVEYAKSLLLALKLLLARLTGSPFAAQREAAIASVGSILYYGAGARLRITLISLAAGAGLAIAGTVFQTAYRNPMASPNLLGASAGVNLGNVLVVMLYSAAAYEQVLLRYKLCYGVTAVCVGGGFCCWAGWPEAGRIALLHWKWSWRVRFCPKSSKRWPCSSFTT